MYKMATTWFPRQLFSILDGGSCAPNISTKLQQRWREGEVRRKSSTIIVPHEALGGVYHIDASLVPQARDWWQIRSWSASLAPNRSLVVDYRKQTSN